MRLFMIDNRFEPLLVQMFPGYKNEVKKRIGLVFRLRNNHKAIFTGMNFFSFVDTLEQPHQSPCKKHEMNGCPAQVNQRCHLQNAESRLMSIILDNHRVKVNDVFLQG